MTNKKLKIIDLEVYQLFWLVKNDTKMIFINFQLSSNHIKCATPNEKKLHPYGHAWRTDEGNQQSHHNFRTTADSHSKC